ncbi:MAG TPA: hypothetical protein ENN60_03040 [archaeon]|nr:hypothetical protein [archaeon]
MTARTFLIAGIDFIINKQNEPVFIEANSSPGSKLLKASDQNHIFNEIARAVKKRVPDPNGAIICRLSERDEGTDWKLAQLNQAFPVHLGYFENQKYDQPGMIDERGQHHDINVFLYNIFGFAQLYRGPALMCNTREVIRVTMDKHLSSMVVDNLTDVKVPETFLAFGTYNLETIVEKLPETFRDGVVWKPNFGWGGHGVKVWSKVPGSWPKTGQGRVLQSRVDVQLKDKKFWDVRCYVIDGKMCGAVSRTSKAPVVNLKQGGQLGQLEPEYAELVKKPAEQVVAAIDRTAEFLSGLTD